MLSNLDGNSLIDFQDKFIYSWSSFLLYDHASSSDIDILFLFICEICRIVYIIKFISYRHVY